MGRPSNRSARREEIVRALETVLATQGLGGATIAAIADAAGYAPGLVHHHFEDREDLMRELVRSLTGRFRAQLPTDAEPGAFFDSYVGAALALGPKPGRIAAKAWVGLFAEAIRSPSVGALLRSVLRTEMARVEQRYVDAGSTAREAEHAAAGLIASILGCLVFGALLPGKASGFAAPYVRAMGASKT